MVKAADELKAYKQEWYAKNSEREKQKRRDYYQANKAKAIANSREWSLANPERVKERQARWRAANPDKLRELNRKSRLKLAYGLTVEEWETMFEAQGRACKCCGSPDPKASNGWHVDHCHDSKRVRGILCQQCNIMLGCAADDPSILKKGAEYLLLA